MDFTSTRLPYRQTGAFPSLALDYIDQADSLRSFFRHIPSVQGIQKAIEERRKFNTDRNTLVSVLEKQYSGIDLPEEVRKNIRSLSSPETFAITTAHQNNLFTGPLYFIYKIIHTIRLSQHLRASMPGCDFVPVFYMGSEDADLDELNHINLGKEKISWQTDQHGAVGRMEVDDLLITLIDRMDGELSVQPYGKELIEATRNFYKKGSRIQDATFKLVNFLFGHYGLIVLLPDNARLKKQMDTIFRDDLLNRSASAVVRSAIEELEKNNYKVQANPREINLFYLKDDLRERIEVVNDKNGTPVWVVLNSDLSFTKDELIKELELHPERFSPNVILRGLYQETILPNIAFVGGSGELAYWLQLNSLFSHYNVPFPVLVLRNSYLIIEKKWREKISKPGLVVEDLFLQEDEILRRLVIKLRGHELKLNGSLTEVEQLYDSFKEQAAAADPTLEIHVDALRSQAIARLLELEKKMVRAGKRKLSDQQRQIHALKEKLFPSNGLQERYDNIFYYYAKWGRGFLEALLEHAGALEQEFCILEEK